MGGEGSVGSRGERRQTGAAWAEQDSVWCDGSKGRSGQQGQKRALWGVMAARAAVSGAEPPLSPAPAG